MFSCASTVDTVLIKSHSKLICTAYSLSIYVIGEKKPECGTSFFLGESTGPNWAFLTIIDRLPPNYGGFRPIPVELQSFYHIFMRIAE